MNNQITTFIAVCTLLLTLNGCSEKEGAATTPSQTSGDNATGASQKLISRMKNSPTDGANSGDNAAGVIQKATATAEARTEVVKAKSADAIANDAAQSEAAAAASQVQNLIDQAGKLVTEKKWSEALTLLNQLTGKSLTPEQQSLVQSLTGQAQKASETAAKTRAVDEATKSVGGLLPKK